MNMEIQAALDVADETDSFLQITDVIYDKEEESGYDALNEAERTVFCIDQLLREMENGGFVQFFHHEAGYRAEDTLSALDNIKAKVSHKLLDQVINLFPERCIPEDEDARIEEFDRIESEHADEVAELDEHFYDSGENLVGMTLRYVQRNLREFH